MRTIRRRKYWHRTALLATAWTLAHLIGLTLVLAPGSASAQVNITVVMSGLDNPRGLAFVPDGGL